MQQSYIDRMMRSRDPRYVRLAEKLSKPKPKRIADPVEELARLRADYHRITGKRPFHGWDALKLMAKIVEANG